MLIVAIPKSASTSLVQTLSRLHSRPGRQDFSVALFPTPECFPILANYHSDIRELDREQFLRWSARSSFLKQHTPPTPNNIEAIRGIPLVLLLRNPEDIVQSYRRSALRFNAGPEAHRDMLERIDHVHQRLGRANRSNCVVTGQFGDRFTQVYSGEEWAQLAHGIGLVDELQRWTEGWLAALDGRPVIHYDDLIHDPSGTINGIEDYFQLPLSRHPVTLSKARFTRDRPQPAAA